MGLQLHNKGVSVALFDSAVTLDASFAGAVTAQNRPEGYVDVLAVQGNDTEDTQIPPVYEGAYEDIQSKKKAVRRAAFADTDSNASDASDADYSELTPEDKPVQNAAGETISRQSSYTVRENGFEEDAALGIEKKGGITLGEANADGGVAEIVAYNADNGKAYVVNGQDSLLNVFDVNADGSFGAKTELNISALMAEEDASFTYGDMTSVAVDTVNDRIAVALQDADYTKAGRVAVLNYDNEIIAVNTTGVQPDMLTFAADGRYILTADEGEPREGYGTGTTDPRARSPSSTRRRRRTRRRSSGSGPSIPQRSRRRAWSSTAMPRGTSFRRRQTSSPNTSRSAAVRRTSPCRRRTRSPCWILRQARSRAYIRSGSRITAKQKTRSTWTIRTGRICPKRMKIPTACTCPTASPCTR